MTLEKLSISRKPYEITVLSPDTFDNLHLNKSKFIQCLKVTSAIKHRNTAEEIISYAHRVYSLLLKLEKNKIQYSYFHFTMLLAFERQFRF